MQSIVDKIRDRIGSNDRDYLETSLWALPLQGLLVGAMVALFPKAIDSGIVWPPVFLGFMLLVVSLITIFRARFLWVELLPRLNTDKEIK